MTGPPKYAVHPGWVRSIVDGDRHYIGVGALVKLYGLKRGEYVIWDRLDRGRIQGLNWDDYVHLYPLDHYEKYKAAAAQIAKVRRQEREQLDRP